MQRGVFKMDKETLDLVIKVTKKQIERKNNKKDDSK